MIRILCFYTHFNKHIDIFIYIANCKIVHSDSALVLQELLDQPISELLSSADESTASIGNSPSPSPMGVPPPKPKRKPASLPLIASDGVLYEEENECESGAQMVTENDLKTLESNDKTQDSDENVFHFPMSHRSSSRSSSCSDGRSHLLQRADTAPIFNSDVQDTDYWIS